MSIVSIGFCMFFIGVFVLYYILPQKVKKLWLLLTSYAFYATFGLSSVVILVATTVVVYIGAILIEKANSTNEAKMIMIIEITLNICLLLLFKYTGFLADNINNITSKTGIIPEINVPTFVLPLGISFYIFSSMSYTIDVYRKKIEPEKNLIKYALFISYFPKITAGPIERYGSFKEQIEKKIKFDYEEVKDGFLLAVLGLIQKSVVADRLGTLTATVFGAVQNYEGFIIFFASIMYTLRIYYDFAGYSNIALGISQMLGIKLRDNFRQPYLATTIRDFWKRWHISLTSWFGDYLYIPLGGNRKGNIRKQLNILIVFIISGLWHGSSWSFVFWGLLHGAYQVLENIISPWLNKINERFCTKIQSFGYRFGQRFVTFMLVNFAWIFFAASGMRTAITLIRRMFSSYNPWVLWDGSLLKLGLNNKELTLVFVSIVILIFIDACREKRSMRKWIKEQPIWFRWMLYLVMIFTVIIFGTYNTDYSAGDFIYNDF